MTVRMKPDRDIVEELVGGAVWAREVRIFLARKIGVVQVRQGTDVTVTFRTCIEAEQFKKLLTSKRGRMTR